MASKGIKRPEINPKFFYGRIVDWKFRDKMTYDRGKYSVRFQLTFENGQTIGKQVGGMKTLKEAQKMKETILISLHERKYVPFDFTVMEFFDYWLYHYMLEEREIAYNTFTNYRNIIYNYFVHTFGNMKLKDIDRAILVKALLGLDTPSKLNQGYCVIGGAFSYAHRQNLISHNMGKAAVREVRGIMKARKKNNVENKPQINENKLTLSANQVLQILYTCKHQEPDIYLPLLLSLTTGLRVSETLAIKMEDIDFGKKQLIIQRQLGRRTDDRGLEDNMVLSQAITPKTDNGIRRVPLADFVLDEIVLAIQRYQEKKSTTEEFFDFGYLSCQANGKPMLKDQKFYNAYRRLFETTNIPYLRWHGLRHTYATLLSRNSINLKAISSFMGHSSPTFTKDVYIEDTVIVYDAVDEIEEFISEISNYDSQEPEESIDDVNAMAEEYFL